MVNYRPEILFNISELIRKRIDKVWTDTHKTYVVKFSIPYNQLVHDDLDETDFLYKAFYNVVDELEDEEVLLQDHITVPPEDIISIERFDFNIKSI